MNEPDPSTDNYVDVTRQWAPASVYIFAVVLKKLIMPVEAHIFPGYIQAELLKRVAVD